MLPSLYPVLVAIAGTLGGFLVAWGATRATTAQLRREVDDLRIEVRALNTAVAHLTTQLAVLTALDERDRAVAGGTPLGLTDSSPARR